MLRLWLLVIAAPLAAQNGGAEFFEKKIRPVLAARCYACHSSKGKSPMGGLVLDTKAGMLRGGASGAVMVAGKPEESRLVKALRFTNPQLQMPPTGKLADGVIADFVTWIAAGAEDPRVDLVAAPVAGPGPGTSIEAGRKWWSFQPVREDVAPKVRTAGWAKGKVDLFLLQKLEENKLKPSAAADARTLLRRASLDLTGIAPGYEEMEAYAKDTAADKYRRLVDRLLASPRYGERWGRYWLDVARYAEDNPTSEVTNPPFLYAWRYRDWVIEAVNKDVAYDRFVKLQLAADSMAGTGREDLRALGYVGAAPVYHKDARLSAEVIETLASDDWDERVDAVTRGLLGLTVACARCHDHKFDPILTKDYYALAGVFASTAAVQRPMREMDAETETRFLWVQQRWIHLDYLAKTLTGEPGTKPVESAKKVVLYKAGIEKLRAEIGPWKERYPELHEKLMKIGTEEKRVPGASLPGSELPFINAVYDAGLWVDGSDPDITYMDYRPRQARDLPVFPRGNVMAHGEAAPRKFLTVLAKGANDAFRHGSGRLELADKIFSDAPALAARVMVNRVWAWHFGKGLVATASDFGTQGEKASHPELLDDLAARFIAHGWSLKWLHREMMLSAAYQQSSRPRVDGEQADPANRWLWRMNPRRLDIEAYRDSILQATGMLQLDMGGPSAELDAEGNARRTVYARVSRSRLNTVLQLYDFSDPSQHSPGRELTTTPLQQLFVMNSPFLREQAAKLAGRVEGEADDSSRIRELYRKALSRDPSAKELDLAVSYLNQGTLPHLAQAILSTNELIFWP